MRHFHGINIVRCEVVTSKWTLLIGAYLLPYTLEHLQYLTVALTRFHYQYPILLGYLNAKIQSQNPCSHHVTYLLMEFGLVDLHLHLVNAGGSDTCNLVSDAAQKIVVEKMCIHI